MTKEEAIKSLRKMAFKSHPLNITNDCVDLESAIELVEELFEQKLNIHSVSGKRPFQCPNCQATLQEVEMTNSEIIAALKAAGVPTRSDGKAGD